MFTANGRAKGPKSTRSARASVGGKEFTCSACGKTKRVTNVEFGEQVLCECGAPMAESHAG